MMKKVKILGGETNMISYEGLENTLKESLGFKAQYISMRYKNF